MAPPCIRRRHRKTGVEPEFCRMASLVAGSYEKLRFDPGFLGEVGEQRGTGIFGDWRNFDLIVFVVNARREQQ